MNTLKLAAPVTQASDAAEGKVEPALLRAQGKVQVVVQLSRPSLAEAVAAQGLSTAAVDAVAQVSAVQQQQQAQVVQTVQSLDGGTRRCWARRRRRSTP